MAYHFIPPLLANYQAVWIDGDLKVYLRFVHKYNHIWQKIITHYSS